MIRKLEWKIFAATRFGVDALGALTWGGLVPRQPQQLRYATPSAFGKAIGVRWPKMSKLQGALSERSIRRRLQRSCDASSGGPSRSRPFLRSMAIIKV